MRDGVDLVADHYRPLTSNPAGTLLVRTPYGRGYPVSTLFGGVHASRGYHVVVQSVRGTFGSGGDFQPFTAEIADGADTAAWLRDQAWFTGSFATIGASYLGENLKALAVGGQIVTIGLLGGAKGELDIAKAQSELAVMAAQIAALRKYRQKK